MLLNNNNSPYNYTQFGNQSPYNNFGTTSNLAKRSIKDKNSEEEGAKNTNSTDQSKEVSSNSVVENDSPIQNVLGGVLQKILNFQQESIQSTQAKLQVQENAQGSTATAELFYSTSEQFSFDAVMIGEDGNRYQVSVEITITQTFYSKFQAEGLNLESLKERLNGSEFDFKGDASNLPSDRKFKFLFDDNGASNQLSSLVLPLNNIFGKLLGDNKQSSLLDGLRIFDNSQTTEKSKDGGEVSSKTENTQDSSRVQNTMNNNQLLAIGEIDYGIFVFNKIQGLMGDLLSSQLVASQKNTEATQSNNAKEAQQDLKLERFKQNTIKNALKAYHTSLLVQFEQPQQSTIQQTF